MAVLSYIRHPPHLTPTPNQRATWHADEIGAGWRSQTIGEIFKGTDGACADPDTRIFPATGGGGAAVPPSSFVNLTFTSHAAFFDSFLGSKKESYPSFPLVPLPHFLVNIRWRILTTRAISGMLYMLQKC